MNTNNTRKTNSTIKTNSTRKQKCIQTFVPMYLRKTMKSNKKIVSMIKVVMK
jgi:hypothetical protein